MEKNKRNLIILGGLVVVFIGVSVNSFITVRKKIAKAKKSGQVQPRTFTSPAVSSLSQESPGSSSGESLSEQFSWGADPFSGRRIDVGSGSGPTLTVSGIVYNSESPNESYAIIDNFIVRVGDRIAGSKFKVTQISKETVTLTDEDNNKVELKVW